MDQRICSVNDAECCPGRLRVGMCERHYRRMRATGSTASRNRPIFERYEVAPSGCWSWAGGSYGNGYGRLASKRHGTPLAHRAFWIEHRGPIPDGLDIDHLCRNRLCVNPDHLEPVPHAVNMARGANSYSLRATCKKGLHDITDPANIYVTRRGRQCKACWRINYRAAAARYRGRRRVREVMRDGSLRT